MVPDPWPSSIHDCIHNGLTRSGRAVISSFKTTRDWLWEPLRVEQASHLVATLIAVALGTALTWFFAWRGITLGRTGIRTTIQGNYLTAGQICLGGVCHSQFHVLDI